MLTKMGTFAVISSLSLSAHAVDTEALKEKAQALLEESSTVLEEVSGDWGQNLKQFGSSLWSKGEAAAKIAQQELDKAQQYLQDKQAEQQAQPDAAAEKKPETLAL